MGLPLKQIVYRGARALGLFALARRLTRDRLRILAYHGFARGDALRFQPKLFISPEVFAERMALLARRGFRVVRLDDAVQALQGGRELGEAVVVTIDDGYASTLEIAAPVLQRHGMPATVYVTTYHVLRQTPVFDLVIGFMLWKTAAPQLRWPGAAGQPPRELALSSPAGRDAAVELLLAEGRALDGEPARVAMCRRLGEALGVPYDEIAAAGTFRLMSAEELQRVEAAGIEIELHTHRHRFPPGDEAACRREIEDNAAELARLTGRRCTHFCYPSGRYEPLQWPWLQAAGVRSATTCDTGLVRRGDPPFGLRRFLDGEMVSEVEFDAEVCGFAELLRSLVGVNRAGRGLPA